MLALVSDVNTPAAAVVPPITTLSTVPPCNAAVLATKLVTLVTPVDPDTHNRTEPPALSAILSLLAVPTLVNQIPFPVDDASDTAVDDDNDVNAPAAFTVPPIAVPSMDPPLTTRL